MGAHVVDLDEMLAFIEDKARASILYASSSKEDKQLHLAIGGGYLIYHGGNVVWQGTDGRAAVHKYNAINRRP